MEDNSIEKKIDLRVVGRKLYDNRKLFMIVWVVVFVVTCAYLLCIPRGYRTMLQLAPEMGGDMKGGNLMNIASTLGFGAEGMTSGDAISPLLYPELMQDNGFVASLYGIRVRDTESEIDTTFYAYMEYFQKYPFWTYAIGAVKSLFSSSEEEGDSEYDPYNVSRHETSLMEAIRSSIVISVDKETAVITISTLAQDPLIARTIADSVKCRLQEYITDYRTGKARVDMEYYCKLRNQAWHEYDSVSAKYAGLADSDRDIIYRTYSLKLEKMERDMQAKYNTYMAMENQYQTALAKVQERTPAFVTFKGAEVPVRPATPRRMLTVFVMMFLSTIVTASWVLRRELLDIMLA